MHVYFNSGVLLFAFTLQIIYYIVSMHTVCSASNCGFEGGRGTGDINFMELSVSTFY